MAVHTTKLNVLSVQINHTITYFYRADTDPIDDRLLLCLQDQRVKIRILCIPKYRILNAKLHLCFIRHRQIIQWHFLLFTAFCQTWFLSFVGWRTQASLCDDLTFRIFNTCIYRKIPACQQTMHIYRRCGSFYVGSNAVIPYMPLWTFQQIYISKNATHPKFILILQIRTVTPL